MGLLIAFIIFFSGCSASAQWGANMANPANPLSPLNPRNLDEGIPPSGNFGRPTAPEKKTVLVSRNDDGLISFSICEWFGGDADPFNCQVLEKVSATSLLEIQREIALQKHKCLKSVGVTAPMLGIVSMGLFMGYGALLTTAEAGLLMRQWGRITGATVSIGALILGVAYGIDQWSCRSSLNRMLFLMTKRVYELSLASIPSGSQRLNELRGFEKDFVYALVNDLKRAQSK